LPSDSLSFVLFPVEHPERFDAVLTGAGDRVTEIQVKSPDAATHWVWGALKMPGSVLHDLQKLWISRGDEYLGTLVNAYLERGGSAYGYKVGEAYVDVGTLNGYREALRVLDANCAELNQA
jgi:dTDP-glucose pyrophosphorylase